MSSFTKEHFIAKFEAIPDDRWIQGRFGDGNNRCAMGHCGWGDPDAEIEEGTALLEMFQAAGIRSVSNVNDGHDVRFSQPTPKERILAALRDLP